MRELRRGEEYLKWTKAKTWINSNTMKRASRRFLDWFFELAEGEVKDAR
jgi:hypothetical protein